jgi:hypothetical protein
MSTKTTFKRVALVAVAALGFGTLTALVPASALTKTATSVSAGTVSASRVGVATTIPVTFTVTPSAVNTNDTTTVYMKVTSAPAGSAFATQQYTGTAGYVAGVQATGTPNKASLAIGSASVTPLVGSASSNTIVTTGTTISATDSSTVYAQTTESSTVATAMTFTMNLSVTTDVAGSYTVLIGTSANAAGSVTSYTAGDVTTAVTFTTAGAPTAITLTRLNSTTTDSSVAGSLVTVALKDAAGLATTLAANEALDFAVTGTSILVGKVGIADTTGVQAGTSLATADFWNNGTAVIRVYTSGVSADTTAILTVSGSGLLPATLTSNTTISVLNSTAAASGQTFAMTSATGFEANTAPSYFTNKSSAGYTFTGASVTATTVYGVEIVDQDNQIVTGATGDLTWGIAATVAGTTATAATTGTFSVSATLAAGKVVTIKGGTTTATLTGKTAVIGAVAATLANVVAATASTTTLTAKVTDNFGVAMANQTVLVSVSGRNASAASVSRSTDSKGFVSYDLVDATTATGTSSLVTFTITGGTTNSATSTVIFGTPAVSTVTLTGGNTTAGVTAAVVTNRDIYADGVAAGAEGATYGFAATVKDASGNFLAGVPVTWTVSGTGAAFPSTSKVTYTSALGVASTTIYGWIAGTYTVTGTAGTVAATGTITFAQTAAGEERVISGSVNGSIVTAKVVDRFGNPVPLVTVYASKTGTGYFGTGVTKTSTTTNAAGEAEFAVTGDAEVTLSTISYDALAGAFGSGQTSAPKGYAKNSTTAAGLALQILLASTTGTTTVAEEGVGASFGDAGVATVKVTVTGDNSAQSAADAAAEATDAANAATDAANAAAEAADAATAAAQDAADAVAALSTQVSEMVNALKKQITALTNLVIKIQKKVKA